MAFDSWGVMPDLEEDEFVIAFRNTNPQPGEPFMRTTDSMSENEIRAELKKINVPEALADVEIMQAKKKWKEQNPRV